MCEHVVRVPQRYNMTIKVALLRTSSMYRNLKMIYCFAFIFIFSGKYLGHLKKLTFKHSFLHEHVKISEHFLIIVRK